MTSAAHILQARARLLALLGEVTDLVSARALERCPYRGRDDLCTFRGGCRNQRRPPAEPARCCGAALNAAPAGPAARSHASQTSRAHRTVFPRESARAAPARGGGSAL